MNNASSKEVSDQEIYDKTVEEMFQAGLLGSDRDQISARLKRANRIAIAISATGISLGMTLMLFPNLLFLSMVIKTLCFWVGIGIVYLSKGLYTFKTRSKNDPHPTVFYAMAWPTIVACWTAIKLTPTYVSWLIPFLEIILIGILLNGLMMLMDKNLRKGNRSYLHFLFNLGIPYAFVTVTFYNVAIDNRPIEHYEVKVLNIMEGKDSVIQLEPWGPCEDIRKLRTKTEDRKNLRVGRMVAIELHKGFLGNSWFQLSEQKK